jgi:hypothetical protein
MAMATNHPSYRVLLARDEWRFRDAVVAALRTAVESHPNIAGSMIIVSRAAFEHDRTSVEGDYRCGVDEIASIADLVSETIDREKGKP